MLIFWLGAEITLRILFPQETLYPRSGFSAQYCSIPFASVSMVHARPGKWRYRYTTNQYHHRGPALSVEDASATKNIVVLGDSYSFGIGVRDGQEYPAVLQRELGTNYGVVNLSAGGWGLTQEIRRFYDFGVRYHPQEVILQFCKNDLMDNLNCPVTSVEGTQFSFHDCDLGMFRMKELLSRSIVQKSQLYNLVRDAAYTLAQQRQINAAKAKMGSGSPGDRISSEEELYIRLLDAFAKDLNERGIRLILLAVNGQLHECPVVEGTVFELQRRNFLEYYDAAGWLSGESGYESPEGHLWGERAHRIIGLRLGGVIHEAEPSN